MLPRSLLPISPPFRCCYVTQPSDPNATVSQSLAMPHRILIQLGLIRLIEATGSRIY